ncbi:MAG TPA: 4-hydroxy-tetrahydrodipicolinate synthase [Dehalococcoidia bacterium]|nr:4-hydroxy-tetrahydrodipicolinate synthase [Dehalococcoidia bacterium]
MATTIGRLLTAMVTPFDEAGEVDYVAARRLARALVASGSDGLVVTGTTGESPTLTTEEKLRLYREVKDEVGGSASVIAGTGNYSTRESIELTREAERIGVDGCLLVVPYYNKPPQDGLYAHFRTIAEATSLPCILYNVPSRTITNMTAETTIRLSEIPNVAGIKEASANMEQIGKIIQGTRDDFLIWSGNDGDTLPILALGGYGVVSVASHLVGNQLQDMIRAFVKGDTARAAQIHNGLLDLVNHLFITTSPIPVKYLLNKAGFPAGPTRLPLGPADAKTATALDAMLTRITVDLPIEQPAAV